jgi:hypothetical protein
MAIEEGLSPNDAARKAMEELSGPASGAGRIPVAHPPHFAAAAPVNDAIMLAWSRHSPPLF